MIVKDIVQELTKNSQEILLAGWSLLLSHRQNFLTNHLARVPITSNQERNMEMRDEALSSVGAQDLYTSESQVSDVDDAEFYWENDQQDVHSHFRPSIDTLVSPAIFNYFEMDSRFENLILIDKEQDKENSPPPHPTTPVSETPIQTLSLETSCPFGTRNENIPACVHTIYLKQIENYCVCTLI